MWDLPGSGMEPVFPALAAGFLTYGPTGKSPLWVSFSEAQLLAASFPNTRS